MGEAVLKIVESDVTDVSRLVEKYFTEYHNGPSGYDYKLHEEVLEFLSRTPDLDRVIINAGTQKSGLSEEAAITLCTEHYEGRWILELGENDLKHTDLFLSNGAIRYIAVDIHSDERILKDGRDYRSRNPDDFFHLEELGNKYFKRPTFKFDDKIYFVNGDFRRIKKGRLFDFLFTNAIVINLEIFREHVNQNNTYSTTDVNQISQHIKKGGHLLIDLNYGYGVCYKEKSEHLMTSMQHIKEFWVLDNSPNTTKNHKTLSVYGLFQKI